MYVDLVNIIYESLLDPLALFGFSGQLKKLPSGWLIIIAEVTHDSTAKVNGQHCQHCIYESMTIFEVETVRSKMIFSESVSSGLFQSEP